MFYCITLYCNAFYTIFTMLKLCSIYYTIWQNTGLHDSLLHCTKWYYNIVCIKCLICMLCQTTLYMSGVLKHITQQSMSKVTDDDKMAWHFINKCNISHNSHIYHLIIKDSESATVCVNICMCSRTDFSLWTWGTVSKYFNNNTSSSFLIASKIRLAL